MRKEEYVLKYYNEALICEQKSKIPYLFTLGQCAVETLWGDKAPGNMMFGIKDTDGINGNEQLVTTTEYLKDANAKFPVIVSKTWIEKIKKYKYIVKTWFRKYNSPSESFIDHAKFFMTNARYKDNFTKCGNDPYAWADEVARDGYATGVNYAATIKSVMYSIENVITKLKKEGKLK